MEHSIPCLKEGLQHLMWLHFQTEPFHENDFNILPPSITRYASSDPLILDLSPQTCPPAALGNLLEHC